MAPTRLLALDELRNTIARAYVQRGALPSTLCSLWELDETGAGDKTVEHAAMLQLNIPGALKADAEDFAAAEAGTGCACGWYKIMRSRFAGL